MLAHCSLFTGIDGFGVACQRAGIASAWACEIDAQCRSVLRHHYRDLEIIEDVHDVRPNGFVRPDLITAGWPCQGNSVAGRRAGMADERSGLWGEVKRVLAEFRPPWFLGENVPGILSVNSGRDFGAVLGDLAELGYGFAYRVCDAQWWGVAQRRRRVFVVGCLGDWRRAAEVLFESESLPWDSPPSRTTGERVAASLTRGTDSSGNGGYAGRRREDDLNLAGTLHATDGGMSIDRVGEIVPIADALRAKRPGEGGIAGDGSHLVATSIMAHGGLHDSGGQQNCVIAHKLRSEGFDASEDGTGRGTPLVAAIHPHCIGGRDATVGHQGKEYLSDGSAYTMDSRGVAQAVAFQTRIGRNGRGQPKEITDALTSCEGGTHADSKPHVAGTFGVRRLTPRECERLQGFPDDWTLLSHDGKQISDSARYRMLGNAVAVPCVEWIARRIALRHFDRPG